MAQITQSFTPEIVLMFRVATEPDRFKNTGGSRDTRDRQRHRRHRYTGADFTATIHT